jgi:cyanophycinase
MTDSPGQSALLAQQGPVALVGSGEYLDVMIDVDVGLLAGRNPRAVLLPTAAAEEGGETVQHWLDLGTRHFARLGVEPVPLRVLTPDDANCRDLAASVAGAGLIYLSGGNPGYLASVLRDSVVWSAIVTAWQGGAALAGCSAGACALSYVADDVRAMPMRGATAEPRISHSLLSRPSGLAAIPEVAVIPHFDRMQRWSPGLAGRYIDRTPAEVTVVGIDEDTAIVTAPGVPGDQAGTRRRFTVAGRQSAWILDRDGSRAEYPAGSTFCVPARSR